ncbi:hypothetical protein [Bosea sp. (in: a-proteobacteria)]|uniref:hypothetical protein n=1 Tax=Bosea sp. (in: a-proteobacteria) TaxID=1871050 RepID=UPI00262C80F1|nr:hypothetical protein [Bosea sp. (in: a-proteobacteria)]MCO5089885.1 hypothetical protein [Bosea sp. (in: a-proteobacteria)]
MKFLAPLTIIGVCLSHPAAAAVSGFYDSAAQLEAIMQSSQVADVVKQLPLRSIARAGSRKDDGTLRWRVRTDRCTLVIYLSANLPQGVGKTTYEVKEVGACK